MHKEHLQKVEAGKKSAIEVLLHNSVGPFHGLPRTAGWGYPEPYTRDLMISILGNVVSENPILIKSTKKVLETLANNQTERGHIPSLVHDKEDRGASDTTPLFLFGVGIFRKVTNETGFLDQAVEKAMRWMEYQSPSDRRLVAQQPTSDWRDEQYVTGYGLFVNTLVFCYLKLLGQDQRADGLKYDMDRFTITNGQAHHHVHEGLVVKHKPYYALWSYKIFSSERFDLLGNCLAILSGIASPTRSEKIISWIENECTSLKKRGELAVDLPPNFFPFIIPGDPDWQLRYLEYNKPGNYHNGGVWPFICGFYIAALVSVKRYKLAEHKLLALTDLVKKTNSINEFGFNEWIKAQDGNAMGQEWQSWSAAMYLYACKCVETRHTPFFDMIRKRT